MEKDVQELINSGVKREIEQLMKKGKIQIHLDHKALRSILDVSDSSIFEDIKHNILETALRGRMEKMIQEDARRFMDNELDRIRKEALAKFGKETRTPSWPYKSNFEVNKEYLDKINNFAERCVNEQFTMLLDKTVKDRLTELKKDLSKSIETFMINKGENIFTNLVTEKLNEFVGAILPWNKEK